MTPNIVAVLVVPADGDPGGVLAPGRCGIIPAMAEMRHTYDPHGAPGPEEWTIVSTLWTVRRALPLWWDGALVPEGWDRLIRTIGTDDAEDATRHPSLVGVLDWAEFARSRGLASRIVRLARVDGRLVEVP
jgi:hypothetical protein